MLTNNTPRRRVICIALVAAALSCLPVYAEWTWTPQTGRWINVKRLPKETAELQVEYARSLMLEGEFKKAIVETEKFTDYYSDTEYADKNQFLRGEIRMAQGKPIEAAREFQQVVAKYPNSALYNDVIKMQYQIGDQLYADGAKQAKKFWAFARKRPYKRASEVYSMVISNEPFTDAAAEAQYKLGLCRHTRKQYIEASFEYKRVIEDYSTSPWVDDAAVGLANCYYDSALPSDYDQQPSQLAITAIDEFKERFPDDARNSELAEKKGKMQESIADQRLKTAQFYEKRRNFESARIYYGIVAKQFAGTAAAEKANGWLQNNQVAKPKLADRILGRTNAS
ncbi:MAG: outer membrane protein assembly factor BamD [Candidatus Hydrogenedentes bacterium]|nr:outer membrane protein assembly factor BamD [Candidatus Hydrogenedentota bacterium]